MLVAYEAVDAKGRKNADSVEAADEQDAVALLRKRGLYVTRVSSAPVAKRVPSTPASPGAIRRFPLKALVLFTRQMTMLLKAGSAVVPALSAIKRQMRKPEHAAMLGGMITDLEDGQTLTDTLRKHPKAFDPVYCAIIAAGEASATLNSMFERLCTLIGKRRAMRNRVIGAMAYPALLITMSVHILLVMLLFVLPRFGGMFEQLGVTPPATTRALLLTSRFLASHWPWLLLAGMSAAAATIWCALSNVGRAWISDLQTSVPIIGRLRTKLIQVQVFRTLGILLESRVGLLDALQLVRQTTQNRRFQDLFESLQRAVDAGAPIYTAFEASRLIDPSVTQAIHTGEDSGRMGEALTYCADVLEETTTELVNTLVKLLEPTILIVMGFLVGGVAVSLFLPLFDLTSAVK